VIGGYGDQLIRVDVVMATSAANALKVADALYDGLFSRVSATGSVCALNLETNEYRFFDRFYVPLETVTSTKGLRAAKAAMANSIDSA
jgi:hypothetical protein